MISKRHFGYETFIIADTKCLFDKLRLKTLQDFYCAFIILCVGTKIIGVQSITQTLVTQLQQLRLNRWTPKSVGTGSPTLDSLVLHGSFRSMLHCKFMASTGAAKFSFFSSPLSVNISYFISFLPLPKSWGFQERFRKRSQFSQAIFFMKKN